MANQFTKNAEQRWNAMPEHDRQLFLSTVWCAQCRGNTTMLEPSCSTVQNDLLLEGKCQDCGAKVRRLID